MPKKRPTVLVVVHDAGEAEIIGSYILANKHKYEFNCYALFPAANVFTRKKIAFSLTANTTKAVNEILDRNGDVSFVLLGTGNGSNISWKYVRECHRRGLGTVGYLEHWSVFRERFGYPTVGWKENVPDTLWVGDRFAEKIAKDLLAHRKTVFVPNRYWREVKNEYKNISSGREHGNELLIVTEPVEYGCPRLLDEILSKLEKKGIRISVRIRLHPREKVSAYREVLKKHTGHIDVRITGNPGIIADLVRAKYVVGVGSMALVIALLCNKKVFAVVPNKRVGYVLPFEKIIKVKSPTAFVEKYFNGK